MARMADTPLTMNEPRPDASRRLLDWVSQPKTSSSMPALKMAVATFTASTVAGLLTVRFAFSSWMEDP